MGSEEDGEYAGCKEFITERRPKVVMAAIVVTILFLILPL